MNFLFTQASKLPDVTIIEGRRFEDERGFFSESFRAGEFEQNGIPHFVQENHSRSSSPTFRGLHYQLEPREQGKLVYCVSGCITDVFVDIRQGSPTYGEWGSIELNSDERLRMVYVPPGFAHGFFAYGKEDAHVIYKVTNYWSSEHERSIRWNDPAIGIEFPTGKLNISAKDAHAPLLEEAENNFYYQEK